ncbi:hypothetical protein HAX54_044239, partial [Datura stramonium]|nr:hypothetical protein [Datura stramonium]
EDMVTPQILNRRLLAIRDVQKEDSSYHSWESFKEFPNLPSIFHCLIDGPSSRRTTHPFNHGTSSESWLGSDKKRTDQLIHYLKDEPSTYPS